MSNRTQFGSAIEPSTLTVPQNKTFNVYLAPPDAPVRAVEIYSFGGYCVTWIYLLPNVVFPLQTRNPITIMQLKGSVEFRNDPVLRGEIILNSKMRLVELKAGLFLHIANTGTDVAQFQVTESYDL
uniref:Uncharacterized protein n=1 Tax=Daphnia galeata TaxID=27404 RepID=A0A8J2VYK9_9CRUS|nr:unnamed protein product [Daphnia galeata]